MTDVDPELLATVPLLQGLGAADRARLAADAAVRRVPAGEWVFRRGDPGDSVHLVLSGRLEILDADDAVIRILGAPSAVGEIALLTGSPRTASVRVRRDADLLRISAERFEQLLADAPELGVALARYLARLLQQGPGVAGGSPRCQAVVAIVGDGARVPVDRFAEAVAVAAGGWTTVARLTARSPEVVAAAGETAWGRIIDTAEHDHELLILVADLRDTGPGGWGRFCIRQADRTFTLVSDDERPDRHPGLAGSDVVLVRPVPGRRVPRWIADLPLRGLHACDARSMSASAGAVARRITGRSIGVVLSGGGARAFAHIGVLEACAARGLLVDRLGGVGTGAVVGGLAAQGRSPDEIVEVCRAEFVEGPSPDYTLPLVALTRGGWSRRMLERMFGDARIEDLTPEFFCVSSNLVDGELVVHRRGRLADAVACSSALPGIAPPVASGGRLLVDGGLLDNMPTDVMAAGDEGPVIAVDVTSTIRWPPAPPAATGPARRGAAWLRAQVVGTSAPLPDIGEIFARVVDLGGADVMDQARNRASLTIRPQTGDTGRLEWSRLDVVRAAGRTAAEAALDAHGPILP